MITSSNEANEARPDRQNNDIPACSKPTGYSLVYYGHRTYVLYFYIPSPLLIEHSSIFPVFVLCTILLYSLRYWVDISEVGYTYRNSDIHIGSWICILDVGYTYPKFKKWRISCKVFWLKRRLIITHGSRFSGARCDVTLTCGSGFVA